MNSMTPYYNYLIDGKFGLNILVYSGDDDDVAATVGTQAWIWDLGYKVRTTLLVGRVCVCVCFFLFPK
jgi:hypothetical protein